MADANSEPSDNIAEEPASNPMVLSTGTSSSTTRSTSSTALAKTVPNPLATSIHQESTSSNNDDGDDDIDINTVTDNPKASHETPPIRNDPHDATGTTSTTTSLLTNKTMEPVHKATSVPLDNVANSSTVVDDSVQQQQLQQPPLAFPPPTTTTTRTTTVEVARTTTTEEARNVPSETIADTSKLNDAITTKPEMELSEQREQPILPSESSKTVQNETTTVERHPTKGAPGSGGAIACSFVDHRDATTLGGQQQQEQQQHAVKKDVETLERTIDAVLSPNNDTDANTNSLNLIDNNTSNIAGKRKLQQSLATEPVSIETKNQPHAASTTAHTISHVQLQQQSHAMGSDKDPHTGPVDPHSARITTWEKYKKSIEAKHGATPAKPKQSLLSDSDQAGVHSDVILVENPTRPATKAPLKKTRTGYASRNLSQLQSTTKRWYKAQQARTGARRATSSSTRLFTLHFNECSVVSICNWSNNNNASNKRARLGASAVPMVDTRFRLCSSCWKYGHYNVECPTLDNASKIQLAKYLMPAVDSDSTKNASKSGNDVVANYDVVSEVCDGFIVEQRSSAEVLQSSEQPSASNERVASGTAQAQEVELDGFLIKTAKTVDILAPKAAKQESFVMQNEFSVGDMVAWIPKKSGTIETLDNNSMDVEGAHEEDRPRRESERIENQSPKERRVCLGVIQEIVGERAFVHLLESIAPRPSDELEKRGDSRVWVPLDDLHLNVEKNTARHRSIRLREATSDLRAARNAMYRRMPMERYIIAGRVNKQDRTMLPLSRPTLLEDGTYKKPYGKQPFGTEWNEAIGIWDIVDIEALEQAWENTRAYHE